MVLPRANHAGPVKPLTTKELDAVARGRYGAMDRIVKRLVETVRVAQAAADQQSVYEIRPVEVLWLEYPDLEPTKRSANDWLRTAVLAYGKYVEQQLEDELRASGGWHLWDTPLDSVEVSKQ